MPPTTSPSPVRRKFQISIATFAVALALGFGTLIGSSTPASAHDPGYGKGGYGVLGYFLGYPKHYGGKHGHHYKKKHQHKKHAYKKHNYKRYKYGKHYNGRRYYRHGYYQHRPYRHHYRSRRHRYSDNYAYRHGYRHGDGHRGKRHYYKKNHTYDRHKRY